MELDKERDRKWDKVYVQKCWKVVRVVSMLMLCVWCIC